MKTKLLYVASFIFLCVTSCTIDENSNDLSVVNKEMKVQKLFDTFSKSAVNSPSYSKLIEKARAKSSSGLTDEEIAQLEQEFLSEQSAEFVELYNYVIDLNLTKEELRDIVLSYFSDTETSGKNDGDDCAISNALGSTLFTWLSELVCEVTGQGNE